MLLLYSFTNNKIFAINNLYKALQILDNIFICVEEEEKKVIFFFFFLIYMNIKDIRLECPKYANLTRINFHLISLNIIDV